MQNHKLAQMQVVAQNTLSHQSLEQYKRPQLKTLRKRKVSRDASPLESFKKRQVSTNLKKTKANVSKYMSKEKRSRSKNSMFNEESMRNQAEDKYFNANISLRESFRHYRPDSEQQRAKVAPTKTSEASDQQVNTGDGNVVSFQNTQTNFVEQLGDIQEQEKTMQDSNAVTSGRNQSQEFLQLLQYSDQLNSKIDKLKQSTQKVKSSAALRPNSVRSQFNQTTPPRNQNTNSIQRSSSKSMTRTKWNLSHNQTPPRRAPSSNRKASGMNTPQSPPSVSEDELTILKYELYKLRGQLKNQQAELFSISQHSALQLSSRDMQIDDCNKQKEGMMKLLKSRNENELKLQNEILEKNNLIKDLTKKLKESTQIILSINLKNGQITKNYEIKLKEKLASKTEEMKKQMARMQQEMQEAHSQEVIKFTRKLEGVQKALQEAESFRGLYSQSKKQLSEMKEELDEASRNTQQLHESHSQRALLEESNQKLQDTINYLAQKLEDSKIDIYNLEEKEKEQKQKQKEQIQKVSEEYESLMDGHKQQSQTLMERKDKEIQDLFDKIKKQEKMMDEKEVAYQNEKDLMASKVNEEIEHMKEQVRRDREKHEEEIQRQTAASGTDEVEKMKETIQEQVQQIQKLEQEKDKRDRAQHDEAEQQLQLVETQVEQLKIELDQRQEVIDTQAVELDKHLDLAQDVEILQKELEYSKIECAHLQSVIEQEKQRISALENSDAAKDQQILQMKSLEQELTETIENFKIKSGASSRTHLNHVGMEHQQLLIEENEQLRHKEKELKKELEKSQEQIQALNHKAEYVSRMEEENKRLIQLKKDNEDLEKQIRVMQEELRSQSENMKSSNHQRDQSIGQLQAQNLELQAEIKQQNKRTQSVDLSKISKQSDIQPYEEQIQQLSMMLATQAQQHQQEKANLQSRVSDLELKENEAQKLVETQKQQIAAGETQRVQLEQEMSFLWEEQSKTQNQNDEGEMEELKYQVSQKDVMIAKLEEDMSLQEKQIKTLINDKTELNGLILTMKNNLKNLRKVFLGQVKTGVTQQKKYLSQTRSQGSIQLDDGNYMISNGSSGRLSEDEISMISKVSISQELKNLENEKELMTSAIAEITENQHQNTQQVQENQKKLAQQLQQAQKLNEQSEKTISDLKTQLQNETESLQQVITELKGHIGQETAQIQELKNQGKQEKEMLIEQLQMVQRENAESLATIESLQSELTKVKEENQKQIEQITVQLITERQRIQELQQTQSNQPIRHESKNENQIIKKLEYQHRQSQQDMQTMKQALSQEALKRQQSLEEIQVVDSDNKDLRADVKQLTEELEQKEDEIMAAYQDYQKQLKSKEEDIEVLQFDLMQAKEQLETWQNRSTSSPGKVSLTLEQEVEIEDLRNENDRLRMELERQRTAAEDQLFEKDHEINAMTKIVSMKDLEINQLATKLSSNQIHGKNDDDLGQYFSNENEQDNAYEMIHQKSPKIAHANDFEQEFLSREQSNATFHSRNKDIEDDLNIYGTEDDSIEKANRNNGFHYQPEQSLVDTNQEESQHAPSIMSHVRGASISPQQPYKQQNMNINLQICETEDAYIDDSFDISKRVKTMNQGKLQASIENLDLIGSKQSLPDKNIVGSKQYKELENRHNKLQQDFNSLSVINKDLLQQISTLTARGDQLEKASSDTTSIFSANEDLKVQLKSKKQQVSSMKQMIASLERDRDNKEIMNKQLQIEMESYAEQVLTMQEKNYTLEMTIESLTKQMAMLASAGNEQAKASRRQIEELSQTSAAQNEEVVTEALVKKKIRSFAQSSFLAPQNDEKEKRMNNEKEKKMAEREKKIAEIKHQKANPVKPKLAITIASQSSSGSKKQKEAVPANKTKKTKMAMF